MSEVVIRKYTKVDRQALRDIAWDTAFLGEPADAFFDSRQILQDFLTAYFTDYEGQSCFVAEAGGKVIGYLIGAKDTVVLEKIFRDKILPRLFMNLFFSCAVFKKKNFFYILGCLRSSLSGEFRMPDFSKDYPATLHINIDKDWRSQHIGAKLMGAYLDYLRRENVSGVRLATASDKAADFFSKQGFTLLHRGRRSYFGHILNSDIPIFIYGKKI
jgi:GNAT superfamily N-acetyltransferase